MAHGYMSPRAWHGHVCGLHKHEPPFDRNVKTKPGEDWAQKLDIPSRFSVTTTAALKSGTPTGRARDDIVDSLATVMMVHTMHPAGSEYNIVCRKLIERYPTLKDSVGTGYVSSCKNA